MKKVYSVINFKGGVCKTTLAVNIAAGLADYPLLYLRTTKTENIVILLFWLLWS
jgi:cellulose biosynthesis protein BcsQ